MTDEVYVYVPMSFPEHLLEPQEWIHVLSTLDVCAFPKQTKFCDPDGYDIIPIRMKNASRQKEPSKEEFHDAMREMEQDEVVLEENASKSEYDTPMSEEEGRDDVVPIRMLRVDHGSEGSSSDYGSSIEEHRETDRNPNTRRTPRRVE